MAERPIPALVQAVLYERARKWAEAQAYARVNEEIPKFRERVAVLIRKYVPDPENSELPKRPHGHELSKPVIDCVLPTKRESVLVKITLARYPRVGELIGDISIAVNGLDHTFENTAEQTSLDSKLREQEKSPPVAGGRVRTWPAWQKLVMPENLEQYSELLSVIENDDVVVIAQPYRWEPQGHF